MSHTICSWCHGMGAFNDFDSDYSYGIPICGGCGGIGSTVASEDFESRVEAIRTLRFKYCPSDMLYGAIDPPLFSDRILALKGLQLALRELFEEYHDSIREKCYAKGVLSQVIPALLKKYQSKIALIEKMKGMPIDKRCPNPELMRKAILAAEEEQYNKAEKIWQQLKDKYPDSSLIAAGYGWFLMSYGYGTKPLEAAASWLEKSVDLKPSMSLHAIQAGRLFAIIGDREKSHRFYRRAYQHPDFAKERDALQQEVLAAIGSSLN